MLIDKIIISYVLKESKSYHIVPWRFEKMYICELFWPTFLGEQACKE